MEDIKILEQIFEGMSVNYGVILPVVGFCIIADFITGILKAYKKDGRINSSKLRDGGFKKSGIIFVIILGYALSVLFGDENFVIYHAVQAYYIYTELISILENLEELGVRLPNLLKKILGHKLEE